MFNRLNFRTVARAVSLEKQHPRETSGIKVPSSIQESIGRNSSVKKLQEKADAMKKKKTKVEGTQTINRDEQEDSRLSNGKGQPVEIRANVRRESKTGKQSEIKTSKKHGNVKKLSGESEVVMDAPFSPIIQRARENKLQQDRTECTSHSVSTPIGSSQLESKNLIHSEYPSCKQASPKITV